MKVAKRDVGVIVLESFKEARIFLMWHCYIMVMFYFFPDVFKSYVMWLIFGAYAAMILVIGVLGSLNNSRRDELSLSNRLLRAYEVKFAEDVDHLSLVRTLVNAGSVSAAVTLLDAMVASNTDVVNHAKRANNIRETKHVQ